MFINDMHKRIYDKLGFDPIFIPLEVQLARENVTHEDDNRPNPLEGLTHEEVEFVKIHRLKFLGID